MSVRYNYRFKAPSILSIGADSLQVSLERFICSHPDFKKNCYGEIQFTCNGSHSTYSPYVTCSPSIDPTLIWLLLIEMWKLPTPNIVISLSGQFQYRDRSCWLDVMNGAWVITNGSSPKSVCEESCSIAVVGLDSIGDAEFLKSDDLRGLFPAELAAKTGQCDDSKLDHMHTHFIFIDGDAIETADFRRKLLSSISTVSTDTQHTTPSLIKIPVIVTLVSDDVDALMHASRATSDGHPLVITDRADRVIKILNMEQTVKSKSSFKDMRSQRILHLISACENEQEKKSIVECIEKWISSDDITIFPSAKNHRLDVAFLHAAIASKKLSLRKEICLTMLWNRIDVFQTLITTGQQYAAHEKEDLSLYLGLALTFDRPEMIEYFQQDLGINMCETLTLKKLHSLYDQALFKCQFATETSGIVHKLISRYGKSQNIWGLLDTVGRVLNHLTRREVGNLYSDAEYQYHGEADKSVRRSSSMSLRETLFGMSEDNTQPLSHPERDLFIWCVLMGKDKLAKVFWKAGPNPITSAVVASAIIRGEAEELDYKTHDSALADILFQNAEKWSRVATDFLERSYNSRKGATRCQITQCLPNLGGCSALCVAYSSKQHEFIAHPATQSALDYIWLGKMKHGLPTYKRFLSMFLCPAVPWMGLVDRTNHFDAVELKNYKSTFMVDKDEIEEDQEKGIGILVHDLRTRHSKCEEFKYLRDFYDYFNSPVTKFCSHTINLVMNIIFVSVLIIASDVNPPYRHCVFTAIAIYVLFYMVGSLVDEFRQMHLTSKKDQVFRFLRWLNNTWNIKDIIMVTSYFIGVSIFLCNYFNNNVWYAGKISMYITLVTLYMRCFQVYLVVPNLGPKVYMMKEMFKDLCIFMLIIGLFIFCYGIIDASLHSCPGHLDSVLKYKNQTFILFFYNVVLRESYWQILGQVQGSITTEQASIYDLTVVISTALYMLFSNILMVNLLIAMFSYTFENIQENANMFWKYNRFGVVEEFGDRLWLPSPFILLEHVVRVIQWSRGSLPSCCAFKRMISNDQQEALTEFEQCILDAVIDDEAQQKKEEDMLLEIKETQKDMQRAIADIGAQLKRIHATRSETSD